MAKLTQQQLEEYDSDLLRSMAQDIARGRWGEETAKQLGRESHGMLIKFILANQDG